ncbi:MAG: transglycosylase domain-containing protein [Pseudomonadota bacterium]
MLLVNISGLFNRKTVLVVCALTVAALVVATIFSIKPMPDDLLAHISVTNKNTYLDRFGKRLNVTYDNKWNNYDFVKIYEIPEFLQTAFILSEDKRFYTHGGLDWLARLSAVKQNIIAGKIVRGASTISEQVVRMLHPRSRTFWSRWVEGFEALILEKKYSKIEILEFYLNQVPYKARRRGIVQAASYYFDRDISTLNKKEMLALAVLVRSPKWLDPKRQVFHLDSAINNLMSRLNIDDSELSEISKQELALCQADIDYDLSHFINYADSRLSPHIPDTGLIHTTIDLELQIKAQKILDNRLDRLKKHQVANGALLIVDHETNEIISWVVGYAGKQNKQFNKIDAVTAKRQPGSALKPLLYANAIRKGWTAATMLDDSPLEESVGLGMHTYHNYSRDHYGLISLREALGNSLNIPAVKAIQYIGPNEFLSFLYDLGIHSLSGHPNVYGDGLALGNGELTLFELVQAYTVLARMGDFKPLSFIEGEHLRSGSYRVLSEDIASLIADIMSDPGAREKEFGWDSILNLPYQTAVKTGTSSDYRDAWALGFNDRYTVGIWIGNLDYSEMNEVTGSSGPAIALRSIFNELNRNREVKPIYFSKNLIKQRVCIETGLTANDDCEPRDEWFAPGTRADGTAAKAKEVRIRKPSKGLMLAMDPRIPDEYEYFEFALTDADDIKNVKWFINKQLVATTDSIKYNWKVMKGEFTTRAEVSFNGSIRPIVTEEIEYKVY